MASKPIATHHYSKSGFIISIWYYYLHPYLSYCARKNSAPKRKFYVPPVFITEMLVVLGESYNLPGNCSGIFFNEVILW